MYQYDNFDTINNQIHHQNFIEKKKEKQTFDSSCKQTFDTSIHFLIFEKINKIESVYLFIFRAFEVPLIFYKFQCKENILH